jgi:hypothetical protein
MRWHPDRIGETVRRELDRFGAAGTLGAIVAVWPEAVGEGIAANAWPARRARDGTLHVAVSSSVWAFELTQLEAAIRERLLERLGGATPARLRFAVGRLPERGSESVTIAKPSAPEVDAEARRAGAEIAAPIEDAELRELVARAAAVSLARARGGADDRSLW